MDDIDFNHFYFCSSHDWLEQVPVDIDNGVKVISYSNYVVLIWKFRSGFDTEPVGSTNSELWIIDERFILRNLESSRIVLIN